MIPRKGLFSLTSQEITSCVVAMGRLLKTKTETAATVPVSKRTTTMEIRISHHFYADNLIVSKLHLFIGGAA